MNSISSMKTIFFSFAILLTLFACTKEEPLIVDGMAPVYISSTDFSYIKSEEPREFENLGNIVNVGKYIFLNERNKGIHVLDNSSPENPINIQFWNIPGNIEFTIVGNILYADNSIHLLVINISDFKNIEVVKYIEDLYINTPPYMERPEEYYIGYFYCVDKKNGIHIEWKRKELIDPLCEAY